MDVLAHNFICCSENSQLKQALKAGSAPTGRTSVFDNHLFAIAGLLILERRRFSWPNYFNAAAITKGCRAKVNCSKGAFNWFYVSSVY